ncbi:MAG: oligopeptide ABC transporter permease [Erysipelotrichaceae bacterium]
MDNPTIRSDDFEIAARSDINIDRTYTSQGFWKDVQGRLFKNKGALFGFAVIVLIVIMALVAPLLSTYTFDGQIIAQQNLPPRWPWIENLGFLDGASRGLNKYQELGLSDVFYLFGSDTLGRDLWVRVWSGTRISLYIAFVAVIIDMVIGMTYGLISGYFGGKVDFVMQRIIEIISGIPNLVIVTLLMMVLGPGMESIILVLMLTGWIGMSRVARAQVLKLKEQEFILASKTLGASDFAIIFKDILPNILGQIIIMSMFSIPNAIFTESFLAFVGLGIAPPMASLGSLIAEGFKSFLVSPYQCIIPSLVLAALMLSFNLFADGLRDAFDPKMKEM